ncbi:MAG: FliO/MopB family protein [Mariniblastus sp.]
MNQKNIFLNTICLRAKNLVAACVATIIFCGNVDPCDAQNDFASQPFPPQQFQNQSSTPPPVTPYGNWTPPVQNSPVRQASHTEPVNPIPGSFGQQFEPLTFPDAPVPFQSTPPTATASADSSIETTLSSAAEMFTNLKESTSEKFSGMFGSIKENGWASKLGSVFGSSDTSRMLGSLALVLGLYFAFVWVMRKINPGANRGLPSEVIEVLGQLPFGPRRDLQLVRLGSKLLLLMNSPDGTQPIGEITDPDEVEHLASLCLGKKKSNVSAVAAIERAARRLTGSRSSESTSTASSSRDNQQATNSGTSVTDVLRALERAAKGGTVFEA